MTRISRLASVVSILAIASLAAGCSTAASPTGSSSTSDSPTATPTPTPTPMVTAPLTGVQYAAGSNAFLAGPVVMGKIDNSSGARPQQGLNSTDVVFDEMVEGGLTRFLAIWQSKLPTEYGPLRSVRPMDPDLATAFGGIISYSGGQAPFVKAMKATGLYNATETSELGKGSMERVTNRVAPHNLFVKAQNLQALHKGLAAPAPFLNFTTAASAGIHSVALNGKSVNSVIARFPAASARWTWKGNLWFRTQDGTVLTDAADGTQISAVNVVVLRVAIDRSFKDPRYGFVPKTLLEGTGTGYAFSGGKVVAVQWSKTSAGKYVTLTDSKGLPIALQPGNTWFELVPTDVGKVTINYTKVVPTSSATPEATKSTK